MKLFLNGALLAPEEARIAPGDRGYTLGDGLFETLCVRNGRILRREAHLARLSRGAAVIGLPLPALDLGDALEQVRAANGLTEAVLRLTISRGEGPRGVLPPAAPNPTVLITAAPLAPAAPPARLVIAQTTRRNERSPLSAIKSLNYLDNILARQEAAAAGADDAVLLNTVDHVAETSIANLFAMLDGELVTPPVRDGALPGIMRAALLALEGTERSLSADDLSRASALFLSSSLGLRPVANLSGRSFDSTAICARLTAALAEA